MPSRSTQHVHHQRQFQQQQNIPQSSQNTFIVSSQPSSPRGRRRSVSQQAMSMSSSTKHSHSHRRSSSRTSTRSSSSQKSPPMVVFNSSLPALDDDIVVRRPASATNGSAKHVSEASTSSSKRAINGNANTTKSKVKKIDWEIPRKTLHSSIGFGVIYLYVTHTSARIIVYYLSASFVAITATDLVRLRIPRFARLYERVLGFLMRESEKQTINGVIWYLIGCITVLSTLPVDIAAVSILILSWCDTTASVFGRLYGPRTPPLPQSLPLPFPISIPNPLALLSSSSQSSTTSKSPSNRIATNSTFNLTHIPIPFAKRKSTAGFVAAAVTGSLIAVGFWGLLAPYGDVPPGREPLLLSNGVGEGLWKVVANLSIIGVITGLVAGVAEAIDLGSLDDNLTLPIISGGMLYACFKWFGFLS